MTEYINIVCMSLIIVAITIFFLIEDCKDKKRGFIAYFILELVNNYVLFRIFQLTETGIVLPQIIVWRIILYVVYTVFKLGWFQMFTEDSYRNFLLSYFYVWISIYTVVGVALFGVMHVTLPEELAVDAMSAMPKTYTGLMLHLLTAVIGIAASIWIKRRNWLQRLSTNFLCVLFAFVFVLADVGSTFMLAKEYIKSDDYLQISGLNVIFLVAASYFGYVNYLKSSAITENKKIQKIMARQFREYEILSRKECEIRRIRHDLANHLQIIKGMRGSQKESFTKHYQNQIRGIYEGIVHVDVPEISQKDSKEKVSRVVAWGIFTIFAVDVLMVIIVSQLILYKVLAYESIVVMQFALILFITLHMWFTFRRTQKVNHELEEKVNNYMGPADTTRLVNTLDEVISKLQTISVQEEEKVLEQLDHMGFVVITGNQILDTMLWHKKSMCREKGIEMEVEWNLPGNIEIDDIDAVGLIGNLLDNAIEACVRMVNRERRIQVKSKKQANIMSIRVRNTKNVFENPVKHKFKTMKSDAENHGIGMKIIKSIVDKYDGTIQCYDEKTEFTVIVNLQVD